MIIDKIENHKLYAGISDKIAKAFSYINKTDLINIAPGTYKIDNDNIFAIVQEYDTKDKSECKLEGHFKYIDIQYIISGVELIGVSSLVNQIAVHTDKEKDYALYESDLTFIKLEETMFTIFFPDDLHMPGLKLDKISKVKKIVVKIRI